MLNKKLCQKCFMKSRQEWFGKCFDRGLTKTHIKYFERQWQEGKCACDHDLRDVTKIRPITISIHEEPPKECPYLLEQIMQGQKTC